jgi:hypothetical protein
MGEQVSLVKGYRSIGIDGKSGSSGCRTAKRKKLM